MVTAQCAFMQAMFPDGRIEEFIEAQSVSAELMATPEVAVSIAAAMAQFHFTMLKHFTMLDHLPSCMSPVAQIWDRLRDWARITGELYKPHELEPYQLIKIRDEVSCSILSGMSLQAFLVLQLTTAAISLPSCTAPYVSKL